MIWLQSHKIRRLFWFIFSDYTMNLKATKLRSGFSSCDLPSQYPFDTRPLSGKFPTLTRVSLYCCSLWLNPRPSVALLCHITLRQARGPPGRPPMGPLSVWHGQSSLATASSPNGLWDVNYTRKFMFDDNANTYWHKAKGFERSVKIMRVDFKVSL